MSRAPRPTAVFSIAATIVVAAIPVAGCGPGASAGGSNQPGEGGSSGGNPGTGGNPGNGGSGTGTGGVGGGGAPTGAGGGPGASADGGAGDGILRDGTCFPVCGFPAISDPDGDGFGFESQRSCLVAGSAAARNGPSCSAPPLPTPPAGADGILAGATCNPICSSSLTDPDGDGYGYEHGRTCIVTGTAAAIGGLPCKTNLPPLPTGDGIMSGTMCYPLCVNTMVAMPDAMGFGFEFNRVCISSASIAALEGVPCDAPDPPAPPPPPLPPPGTGWNADYTATMFGQADCAPLGFNDATNLNNSTCIARRLVTLNAQNQMFFGAAGDLSTLWNGAPACTCIGGQTQGTCGSPPACNGQTDCGQCVEVFCNGTGMYSFMGDGFTHDEFCRPGQSVVVQLIDACPHNHPNNTYWCTAARPNHIDLSCTAFGSITQGRPIADIGSVNVYVRPVACSVGLGVKTF